MNRQRCKRRTGVLIGLLLGGAASLAGAETVIYRWPGVPHAAYYEGTLTKDGAIRRIRTRETWLLLEEGSVLALEAVDDRGTPLRPVTATGAVPAPAPALPAVVEDTPEDESDEREEGEDETRPPPTPPALAGDEEEDAPDQTATPSARGRGELTVVVGLQLGLGKEWMIADGGTSDYAGSSGIGGTALSVIADGGRSSSWQAWLHLSGYNFTSTTRETTTIGTVERESKFLRPAVSAAGFFRFGGAAGDRFGLGVGPLVRYFRMPFLDVEDGSTTGSATLGDGSATLLGAAAHGELDPATNDVIGLSLAYAFVALGDNKGSHAGAHLSWRHRFAAALHSDLGVRVARERLEVAVDCPEVAGCDKASVARADTLQVLAGLALEL